jgi:sugar lactone lactonase YvrE
MKADLVVDARATLGEGPVWHPRKQQISWVDIEQGQLHIHELSGEPDHVYTIGCRVGAAVWRRSGGMVLATESGWISFDLQAGRGEKLADPESHLPNNRFNDGKCDPYGRFWAGTMSMRREPRAGSLYVLEADHGVRRVLDQVTTSNGLDWSPDQSTMYYIDTPTMQVAAFDYDGPSGTIANRRTVVQFPAGVGRPDGMTVDAEGKLWIAHWDGGRVTRWDPRSGRLLDTVHLPVSRVTSCAFGGSWLDELYITTARHGLDEATLAGEPHAGGLFAVCPGATGLPAHEFAG